MRTPEQIAKDMEATLADLQQSLDIGDTDMAGDHALSLEEIAREFQAATA